jgi:hypothetical protein
VHTLSIKLLVVFYLCAGGFIGETVRRSLQGRSSELLGYPWYLWTVLGVNIVALGCLVLLRRRAVAEPPLQRIEHPLRMFVTGLPVTSRVALLLFTASYVIGFVVGLLFA